MVVSRTFVSPSSVRTGFGVIESPSGCQQMEELYTVVNVTVNGTPFRTVSGALGAGTVSKGPVRKTTLGRRMSGGRSGEQSASTTAAAMKSTQEPRVMGRSTPDKATVAY